MCTMLSLYYLMKTSKKKAHENIYDYYDVLPVTNPGKTEDIIYKCRVCLRDGAFSIYGSGNNPNVSEALQNFGDINVSEDDEYPKYLCKICFRFLKGAIIFRKTAKQTDEILNLPSKKEIALDQLQDDYDFEQTDEPNSTSNTNRQKSEEWLKKDNSECINNLEYIKKEKKSIPNTPKVTCNICNKVVNRSYYKVHMTVHDPNPKQYVCDVCGKSFRLRCAYHNHSLRHRSDFAYKCQFCPYRARYRELLNTHMRTHSGDYRYMCTECPARFLFKSNLNSHMLKHKEPQFKCDTCKRAFHTKLTLERHFEADHLGIKNHVCNMCGKAFGYRNAMMKHQRHVHKREKLLYGRMPAYLEDQNKT